MTTTSFTLPASSSSPVVCASTSVVTSVPSVVANFVAPSSSSTLPVVPEGDPVGGVVASLVSSAGVPHGGEVVPPPTEIAKGGGTPDVQRLVVDTEAGWFLFLFFVWFS